MTNADDATRRPERPSPQPPRLRTALFLGATALCSGLALAAAGWYLTGADQNDLAPWIEAVATALALVAASIAGLYAAYAFTLETRREERFVDTQRRAQASIVAAWAAERTDEITGLWSATTILGVNVRNASAVPITSVTVVALNQTHRIGELYYTTAPPTDDPVLLEWDGTTVARIRDLRREGLGYDWHPHVDVYFTDASGIRWHRSWTGALRELGSDEQPLTTRGI